MQLKVLSIQNPLLYPINLDGELEWILSQLGGGLAFKLILGGLLGLGGGIALVQLTFLSILVSPAFAFCMRIVISIC